MYSVHYAKTHLSKLLQQVEDGKNVVLARGKKPIARMIPCHQLPNSNRPEVGSVTSGPIRVKDRREIAGRIGDTVVYF